MVKKNFILGDKWLYYKLFTGEKTADIVLIKLIKPLVDDLLKRNVISKWFYIRYTSPKHHLRIRFELSKKDFLSTVINSLNDKLNYYFKEDLIWRIQTDTYEREIYRYGQNSIHLSEEVFFHDSEMIVNFIQLLQMKSDENLRWLFALKANDDYLNCFGFKTEQKLDLMLKLKNSFGKEFGMSRFLKKQIDAKYRINRERIHFFVNIPRENEEEYNSIINILIKRRQKINGLISMIMKSDDGIDKESLASSYIHMQMNRLFMSKSRMHEMVCYDFLFRYYKSKVAQKNYSLQN